MTVKIIKTGETKEYNDSFGARLIEQGKAVAANPEKKHSKLKKPEVADNVTEEQNP